MEKFDEALDSAKLSLMGLREDNINSITRTKLTLEIIIHAIELLSDEVEKLKQKD